jgi:hypothetical protein
MKPNASTESLRTWQRRSECTRPVSQRKCLPLPGPFLRGEWSQAGTDVELERDLRTVQAMFLFGLLGVISYCGIAIGKNMKGMILAYGLYIATSLVSLAVRSYAPSFDAAGNIA